MKHLLRPLALAVPVALWGSLAALAGSYTVHLSSGELHETRYPPRFGVRDVELLNTAGHWITVPRESVERVTNGDPTAGAVRRIDTHTIAVGWAPNDRPAAATDRAPTAAAALDPVGLLLIALEARPSPPQQDYSVAQFVDTEETVGGFPAAHTHVLNVPELPALEKLLGLPPGGLREILGLPPERNLLETLQGLPTGGLRAVQGLPPVDLQAVALLGAFGTPAPAAAGLPGAVAVSAVE